MRVRNNRFLRLIERTVPRLAAYSDRRPPKAKATRSNRVGCATCRRSVPNDHRISDGTSVWIAVLTVVVALALSVPAGYALARLKLPMRSLFMIVFLLPQAFPSVAIYINVARIFYKLGINGTVLGVVLVHAAHGLVYSV